MPYEITICADADITDALACGLAASPDFLTPHRAVSYESCLAQSFQTKTPVFILQARTPVAYIDDLLFALQNAGFSPVYILFEVVAPRNLRYATTTTANPLAARISEVFQNALRETYVCEPVSFRTTLLSDEQRPSVEAVERHECLLEVLRGCNDQEFKLYRERFGLNLKDRGYYLYFWELMGVEFHDHKSNKFIYNFSGEMLLRECTDIMSRFNGGEVFYLTPNLLCIILNDLDVRSEAVRRTGFEELIQKLAYCTGNRVACRYLSSRVADAQGLRGAYERYLSEKSMAFFLRDMRVIRPALIEARKRFADMKTVNTLLHEITDYLRYDLMNPALVEGLHRLYFDILKPAMSFTLYYSSIAALYSAIAEILYPLDDLMPMVNNTPNLLQFSSIEEQYEILLERVEELRTRVSRRYRTSSAVVMKAVNYISDNYARDISITDISGVLFISSVHLSQIFKRETGLGVMKYLINYRIEKAKDILRETDDYIYTVSENVGFREFRHFSRTFKELTGLSPTEYRKQYGLNRRYHRISNTFQ